MCFRSDNVFGSLSAPGSVEMPITATNNDANVERDDVTMTTYVTKHEHEPKRCRSEGEEQSLDKNGVLKQPPKKKTKEAAAEETEEEEEDFSNSEQCVISSTYTDKDVLSVSGRAPRLF
jgi:hypothetical protein